MTKKKDELNQKHAKKLNLGRCAGFRYDIYLQQNADLVEYENDVDAQYLLTKIKSDRTLHGDDNYTPGKIGALYPLHNCLCVVCSPLAFKLLNLKTFWAYEPIFDKYVYYFKNDDYYRSYLFNHLNYTLSVPIQVFQQYELLFTKSTLPKFCSGWENAHLTSAPNITESVANKIIQISNKINDNYGYFWQLNPICNTYRIGQAVAGRLGKTVMSYNAHALLELILQVVSCSYAIVDNSNTTQSYKCCFKELLQLFKPAGRKKAKAIVFEDALQELIQHGFIDGYAVKDDDLYFASTFLTRHARQKILRPLGFYAGLPAKRPYIATWLNYLWWIRYSQHPQLTVALDTLLGYLDLSNLIRESRLTEIAKVLNILRRHGQDAGYLVKAEDEKEITSKDVKHLLNNRKELNKYVVISPLESGKDR